MRVITYFYKGETKTVEQWKDHFKSNLSSSTLFKRLKKSIPETFERCFVSNRINESEAKQYVGKVIDDIEILKYIGGRHNLLVCRCSCGGELKTSLSRLLARRVRSCGCSRKWIGSKNIKYTGVGDISGTKLNALKNSARERNLEFNISAQYLWDLYLKQSGKCAISGVVISLNSSRSHGELSTASLDRIDSSKGYIEGNVQWTHKDVNIMKQSMSSKIFQSWISIIYEYNHK